MRNRLFIIFTLIFVFLFNQLPVFSAAENTVDPREAAIDRSIGGMEEGSHPLEPQSYADKNQTQQVPGSRLSPSMDTRVTASASSQSPTTSTSIGKPSGAAGESTSGNTNVGAGATTPITEIPKETVSGGTTETALQGNVAVETPPTGGSTHPVTEPVTHPVTEPVTESTSQPVTEPITQPITEPVTEPVTQPVIEPIAEPVTEEPTSGSTEPTTEPASGGGTSDSIVNLDASADLSGGSPVVDANLTVDTNASELADVNATTTTDAASTNITATESGTVAGQDLTTTVNEATVDATLATEVVATDVPAESEATAGLEADVDPVTAASDVTPTDPADGLSTGL